MIKEVKMYTVICDNCGEDLGDNSEYSAWSDESSARDNAVDSEWAVLDSEHGDEQIFCPKCFKSYDDEDNMIIDKTRTKQLKNL